ncbi:TPA: oligosaccharide flippase family protein [Stenotrophomonas maltophilia]
MSQLQTKMKGTALKKISGNAGALLLIQAANALLPLVLAPYLTRTLGKEVYGLFAFGIAIIQVASIFTDYGFGLSAVYQIARARTKRSRIRRISGAVFAIKSLICLLAIIALLLFPLLQSDYNAHREYFWLLSLSVIGLALQPVWLFQGIERMSLITTYVLISRLSFIFLTVLLVKGPNDLVMVALFNGITHIASGAIALVFVRRTGYWPTWPGLRYALIIFRGSTGYFWSRLAVVSYGSGATLFLGAFSTPAQVATYSVAEQFYRGALAVYAPVTQALYPHMARHRDVKLFKRILFAAIILAAVGIAVGLIAGQWLIESIFGHQYDESYPVLLVFMLALAAAIPSILLGYPFLGAMGNATAANRSVLFAGVVQVATLGILFASNQTSAFAVVSAVLIAEVSALIWRIKYAAPYFTLSRSPAS